MLLTLRPDPHELFGARIKGRDRYDLAALDPAAALRLVWDEALRQKLELGASDAPPTPEQAAELEALRRQAALPARLTGAKLDCLAELSELAFQHPALIKLAVAQVAELGWEMRAAACNDCAAKLSSRPWRN